MGIYRRIINENAQPEQLVRIRRKFGLYCGDLSVITSAVDQATAQVYSWMRATIRYAIPALCETIIIMGFFPRIPGDRRQSKRWGWGL